MMKLDKWMVGMDLTLTDETLIAYTKKLFQALNPEIIYFVHIQRSYEKLSLEIELPELEQPSKESIVHAMEEKIFKNFPQDKVSCEVFTGDPQFDLWRETYLHDVDLFIAGSKEKHKGRGLMPKQFARKSFCSILFIPEDASLSINRIMSPIDFSDYSKKALDLAIRIASSFEDCSIVCQNVYELPYAYSLTDSPRQRYVELMNKNASIRFSEFLDGMDTKNVEIDGVFHVRDYPYVAEHIKNEAEAQKADLIVMAAGGKSRLSRIFLGSETEKMVEMEKDIPLMVLKQKEKKVNLWDIVTSIR